MLKSSYSNPWFSRFVTVHATNGSRVTDNVGYDAVGHGYFLEDGNEMRNTIEGNLGLVIRITVVKSGLSILFFNFFFDFRTFSKFCDFRKFSKFCDFRKFSKFCDFKKFSKFCTFR